MISFWLNFEVEAFNWHWLGADIWFRLDWTGSLVDTGAFRTIPTFNRNQLQLIYIARFKRICHSIANWSNSIFNFNLYWKEVNGATFTKSMSDLHRNVLQRIRVYADINKTHFFHKGYKLSCAVNISWQEWSKYRKYYSNFDA